MDGGDIEESPSTEQHGQPSGRDGVEAATAAGLEQHEGEDSCGGSGQREDEKMFLDPSSLQTLM